MAFSMEDYKKIASEKLAKIEALIDVRLRHEIQNEPINNRYAIVIDGITDAEIRALAPRYLKAGWTQIEKNRTGSYYVFEHNLDLSTLTVKEKEQEVVAPPNLEHRSVKI